MKIRRLTVSERAGVGERLVTEGWQRAVEGADKYRALV